jgi:hypothetical protein
MTRRQRGSITAAPLFGVVVIRYGRDGVARSPGLIERTGTRHPGPLPAW